MLCPRKRWQGNCNVLFQRPLGTNRTSNSCQLVWAVGDKLSSVFCGVFCTSTLAKCPACYVMLGEEWKKTNNVVQKEKISPWFYHTVAANYVSQQSDTKTTPQTGWLEVIQWFLLCYLCETLLLHNHYTTLLRFDAAPNVEWMQLNTGHIHAGSPLTAVFLTILYIN